jgi:hypothetical protein
MRKHYYESLFIAVWVGTPFSPLLACAMTSVSEKRAELLVNSSSVPDLFDLLFSPIAQSWRECSVTWCARDRRSVGICFLGRHLALYPGHQRSDVHQNSGLKGAGVARLAQHRQNTDRVSGIEQQHRFG